MFCSFSAPATPPTIGAFISLPVEYIQQVDTIFSWAFISNV